MMDTCSEQRMAVEITTLWRTASAQCEVVRFGVRGDRLRLWVNGSLIVDEEIFDWQDALTRAAELRRDYARLTE